MKSRPDIPPLAAEVERYLVDTLAVTVDLVRWAGQERLALFLSEQYDFFEATILGQPCLFAVDEQTGERPPARIRKEVDRIRDKYAGPVVYVRAQVTAYNRKRLIEQRVAFVVPGNQMYLPTLGIDLREHFRKARAETHALSPSAQAVLLHALLHGRGSDLTAMTLKTALGYSAMTVSRALDQLESAGLGESRQVGRERHLSLVMPRPELWTKAQPFLRSPVMRRVYARRRGRDLPYLHAGLSALAHYSALAEPDTPVVASSSPEWQSAERAGELIVVPNEEPDVLEVEIWSYSPTVLADGDVVDPLSLFLSLRETRDERTEAALDEMLRSVTWR